MHEGQAEDRGRREAFIANLQEGRSVRGAAMAAGINRTLVYKWRGEMPDFAAAWDEAVQAAADLVEEEVWRRAVLGVRKPVFRRGEQVGTVMAYSDRLLMFLLQRLRPVAPPARPSKADVRREQEQRDYAARVAEAHERMARMDAEEEARRAQESAEAAAEVEMEPPEPPAPADDDTEESSPFFAPLDDEAPVPVRAAPPPAPADSAPVAPERRPPWPSDLPDEWRDIPLTQLMRMTYLTSAQVMAVQSYGTPDPDAPTFPPPWDGSDRHLKWPVPRLRDRRA
jgi:hypothetical protein